MSKTISLEVCENPTPGQCLDDLENFLNIYIGPSWEWSQSEVDVQSASIKSLSIWDLEEVDEEKVPF